MASGTDQAMRGAGKKTEGQDGPRRGRRNKLGLMQILRREGVFRSCMFLETPLQTIYVTWVKVVHSVTTDNRFPYFQSRVHRICIFYS